MKKAFNYMSYCIYSFIPLYFVLLVYTLVRQDSEDVILVIVLIISSIFALIALSNTRPTNIFVCSKEEVSKGRGIDYIYLVLMIILTFLIINEKIIFIYKVAFLLIIFLILYKTAFKYKNYTLILLGYQMYTIRDKIVYSKKNESELYMLLKSKKYLQVVEIGDNIYIENEKYTITYFYCKDF